MSEREAQEARQAREARPPAREAPQGRWMAFRRPPARARLRAGVLAGLVAASATAGALLAFGARQGDAWRTFVVLGRLVLGGPPVGDERTRTAVGLVGLLLHLLALVAWGALFGLLAAGTRGLRLFAAAALVTLVAYATNTALALAVLRPGNDITALTPQKAPLLALYVLVAVGLWCGMRVAFSVGGLDER